jgi:hypothetical protein
MKIQALDNLDNIKAIIKWAKEEKIEHLVLGDMEITFHDTCWRSEPEPTKKTALQLKLEKEKKAREDEDTLYWST